MERSHKIGDLRPHDDRDLTAAEVAAASLVVLAAVAILSPYLWYRMGLRVEPFAVLLVSLTTAGAIPVALARRAASNRTETVAFGAIVALVFSWLVWLSRPDLLPMGRGPDLTHHMLLIDYISDHWQLIVDPGLVSYLGDMTAYPPGSHLLISLAAVWTGVDALRAVHPVLAFTVALKCGLVFLVTLRLLPHDVPRIPLAVAAVLLLFVPLEYFMGSLARDSFWAQVVAEMFACAMWWALVAWDERPSRATMGLAAIAGAASFIVFPIWIGPLLLALFAVVVFRGGLTLNERLIHAAIGFGVIAAVAGMHLAGRLQSLAMATISGAVTQPSTALFGWGFVTLSAIGVVLAAGRRKGRATAWLVAFIALQAVVLYVVANSRGADTPYYAYKMMYLAIYPLAATAALALAEIWRIVTRSLGGRGEWLLRLAWPLVALLGVIVARDARVAPWGRPVVSVSVYRAGLWARSHVDPACVDYLVAHDATAYWLHLAVLRNQRTTSRTLDADTFEPKKALIRWIYPDGLPFAVVEDMSALPKDIVNSVEILARFGPSAVVQRPGPPSCP